MFEELLGKTLTSINGLEVGSGAVYFNCSDDSEYKMFHDQDCCELVSIEDINGDVSDLLNSPILVAEEVTSDKNPAGVEMGYQESFTWTFYKLATLKGYVTIRWYGESNGYYSESVAFEKVN